MLWRNERPGSGVRGPGSIALFFYFLFTLVPILLSFGYATLYSFGLVGILNTSFTLSNWTNTLASREVILAFLFSFYVALVSMFITITIALVLTSIFRQEVNRASVIYLPLGIPAIVAAFYTFQLLSKAGLFSLIHDAFGVAIIATHVLMAVPFFTILFTNLNASENLDELRNLARTLGGTVRQVEFKVAIPILLRKAFPTIVLYFIFVLGSYEIPLILGRQYPQMVSVLMIRKLQRFNLLDIPTAYAMAVLYLIITATMIVLLFRGKKLSYDI
jgi:putative spermidine/putrescine transport system permease protein